jgi:transcriptional regulator with XRE-family HTH domain
MPTPNLLPAWEDTTPAKPATPAVALRSLRRREGLSREALARASRLKAGRIADMENGKRSISPEAGNVLAVIFGTTSRVFLPL